MMEIVFVWVLMWGMAGSSVFDTKQACEAKRTDMIERGYGVGKCYKEILTGNTGKNGSSW